MKSMKNLTRRMYCQQGGRCHYCRQPMWLGDSDGFARTHGLRPRQARVLQATAEHLLARCDGGSDSLDNIVAACRYCNRTRHVTAAPLDPEAYRIKVQSRMAVGRWHGLRLN